MPEDLYQTLNISRAATKEEICGAYRELALRYHPDRADPSDPYAAENFAAVAEAYDVLSNPETKALHDRYGVTGLKGGVVQRDVDGSSCTVGGWYKPPEDPESVFRTFFGTENPFAAIYDITELKRAFATDCAIVQGKDEIRNIQCSLEEMYLGCEKRITLPTETSVLSTTISSESNEPAPARVFSIRLRPGVTAGTRFVFPGMAQVSEAHEKASEKQQKINPGDLIFVLQVEKHSRFERQGDDLKHTAKVPLFHALTGCNVQVYTLDNRCLTVPVAGIVHPGSCKIVEGEGMVKCPVNESSTTASTSESEDIKGHCRGDLRIHFDIVFPKFLSPTQRDLLKATFFLPEQLSPEQVGSVLVYNQWGPTDLPYASPLSISINKALIIIINTACNVEMALQAKSVSTFLKAFSNYNHGWELGVPKCETSRNQPS